MNHSTSRLALLAAGLTLSALLPACASDERPPALVESSRTRSPEDASAGSLDLSLTLPTSVTLIAVDYLLIGQSSGTRIEGSVGLDQDYASAFVAGLAADTYSVFLTATLSSDTQCTGTTSVQVFANETVPIHVILSCNGAGSSQGGISLGASIDEATCGFETVSVTPTRVVGSTPIALHATGTSTVSSLSFAWSGPGSFTDPNSADTHYTCGPALGTQHIEIRISDLSGCEQRVGVDVDCLPQTQCGDGQQQFGEACDDGNLLDGDGCSSRCTPELCGDGVVQSALGELCDPPDHGNCSDECLILPNASTRDSAEDTSPSHSSIADASPDAGALDAQAEAVDAHTADAPCADCRDARAQDM